MGRVEGRVALITGAARGQGRAHARRLAEEGANIVALDALTRYGTVSYPMPVEADLEETARLVREVGREVETAKVDVRDRAGMATAVERALERFGGIDIVVANAGIVPPGAVFWEIPEAEWDDVMDVNLKGVWNTVCVAVPSMIERGRGGSIVIISSGAGLRAAPHIADYNASKHGVIGLGRTMANELAKYRIRVNMIAPAAVATEMVLNPTTYKLFCPEIESPTMEDARQRFAALNPMGVAWVEPLDSANMVLWLASEEARYVSGSVIPLDGGALNA